MDNTLIDILTRIYILFSFIFCYVGFVYVTLFTEGSD